MKIKDILRESKRPFPSIEIVPPLRGLTAKELTESIRPFMEFSPKYINVTTHRDEYEYKAGSDGTFSRCLIRNRVSAVAVCGAIMSEFKTDVVPHIICGGSTADEIKSKLFDLRFMGIDNVVALRGDSIIGEKRFTPEPGGYRYASMLVEGIREFEREIGEDCFSIGVGGYPEKHFEAPNIDTDIENLKKKIDAGADYVITQMFFDNEKYYNYVDKCRTAGIKVPIIPGLKPLSSARQLSLLPESFSIDIPFELTREIRKAGDNSKAIYEVGVQWCIDQSKDLLAHNVPAIHFYTMGRSENIVQILKECF